MTSRSNFLNVFLAYLLQGGKSLYYYYYYNYNYHHHHHHHHGGGTEESSALQSHEAEDVRITILRNVSNYLTLDEELTSQKTCTFNIHLFIYFLKWQLTYGLQKYGKVLEYK